ncbi:hypothetical protein D3C86_2092870 [compost metagenome]
MPALLGEVPAAAVGMGDAQRHGAVYRVEVGNLGDDDAVVFEYLRALEFGSGQGQFCQYKAEAQARIDRLQLRPLRRFVIGQMVEGFRHV